MNCNFHNCLYLFSIPKIRHAITLQVLRIMASYLQLLTYLKTVESVDNEIILNFKNNRKSLTYYRLLFSCQCLTITGSIDYYWFFIGTVPCLLMVPITVYGFWSVLYHTMAMNKLIMLWYTSNDVIKIS